MDIATLGLVVTATGAIIALNQFTSAANRATASGTAAETMAHRLRSALATLGVTLGLRELAHWADTWKLIDARIGNVTRSATQQIAVQNEVFNISQRTRVDLEATGTLYTRLAYSTQNLRRSQQDVLTVTEAVNKAYISYGASQQEIIGSTRQFTQALASNRLAGDELRSLLENAPTLARLIAEALGVTLGQLRKMGREGQLTTEVVFNAILKKAHDMDTAFERIPVTISQSFTVLKNAIINWIGHMDRANGVTSLISNSIVSLAKNFNRVVTVIGYVIIAYGAYIFYTKTAAVVTLALPIAQTIGSFLTLAVRIRSVADAEALLILTTQGLDVALKGLLTTARMFAFVLTLIAAGFILWKKHQADLAQERDRFQMTLVGKTDEQLSAMATQQAAEVANAEKRLEQMRRLHQDVTRIPIEHGMVQEIPSAEYTRLQEQAQLGRERLAAIYQQRDALASLKEQTGQNTVTENELTKAERNQLIENQKMVAAARQAIELAKVEGLEQERLRINFEAVNKLIEVRGRFKGDILAASERAIEEERVLRIIELQTRASYELRKAREDAQRTTEQSIRLAGLEGVAQTRARIEAEATNRIIEARRQYEAFPDLLDYALYTIDTERRNQLLLAATEISQQFKDTVRNTMSGVWEDFFENGIKNWKEFLNRIRAMYLHMLSEMVARRFMEGIGQRVAGMLTSVFGEINKLRDTSARPRAGQLANLTPDQRLSGASTALTGAATALTNSATALTGAATALRTGSVPPTVPTTGTVPVPSASVPNPTMSRVDPHTNTMTTQVEVTGITAKASRSWAADAAKFLGPVLAGFMAGFSIGGMTSNRGLGTLGGAAAGALTGAMIGSTIPVVGTAVGAIAGGIAGAIGGFLGSSKRHKEQMQAIADALAQNYARLILMRDSLNGDLMRGTNLSKALSTVTAYQGKSREDLARTAQRFGLSLQQLEAIAQSVGITIYDSAGKLIPGALKQLQEALQITVQSVTRYNNTIADVQARQDAYNKLFDVPDTPGRKLNDAYEQLMKLAPDLMKQMGLANLNLDTEAGRNVLLNGLREIFNLVDKGLLSPELLGAFTDKNQLIDAILGAKDGLDAFKQKLDDVTTDFPRAQDIVLFEQAHGHGTGISEEPTRVPTGPTDVGKGGSINTWTFTVHGPLQVLNEAGDTPEQVVRKMEIGVSDRARTGATTRLPGTVVGSSL